MGTSRARRKASTCGTCHHSTFDTIRRARQGGYAILILGHIQDAALGASLRHSPRQLRHVTHLFGCPRPQLHEVPSEHLPRPTTRHTVTQPIPPAPEPRALRVTLRDGRGEKGCSVYGRAPAHLVLAEEHEQPHADKVQTLPLHSSPTTSPSLAHASPTRGFPGRERQPRQAQARLAPRGG